jgi:tRNA(Ile)-lysidine synthase
MDDQAETFLLRLARGSGARGLSSAYPVVTKSDIDIIRPLIEVRRREILTRLEARGLDCREDTSNLDRGFTRNRLRHDVLPVVRDQLNPNLVETLARTAAILRDEDAFMDAATRRAFVDSASSSPDGVRLSVSALAAAHPAVRRRLIRLAYEHARGDTDNLTSAHVASVLSLLEDGKSGREMHLPGVVAERSFDALVLASARGRARVGPPPHEDPGYGYNEFDYRLTIPAELRIEESRGSLTAHLVESVRAGDEPGAAAGNAVVVGIEDGLSELRVRSPRPSDRFRPLGAPGSKPLARYLMERKVGRRDRRRVPVVVRGEEEILWVCGHAVSEAGRIGAGRRRLHLEWKSQ